MLKIGGNKVKCICTFLKCISNISPQESMLHCIYSYNLALCLFRFPSFMAINFENAWIGSAETHECGGVEGSNIPTKISVLSQEHLQRRILG